ncbi:unnamed protein product [Aphanomyces euteiches]
MPDLGMLRVAPSVLAALYQAGFQTTQDLHGVNARELSNVAKIVLHEAASVINAVKGNNRTTIGITALEVFQKAQAQIPIQTFIPDLDTILGGGISIGEITEICCIPLHPPLIHGISLLGGVPGVGKTQLSVHLALCAQYSDATARDLFETIYIDTEGSFLASRAKTMADSMAKEFAPLSPQGRTVTKEDLLRGITYYRVYDYQEQHDVLLSLSRHLASQPRVRLVIVDSIAFHCRHAFDDNQGRARALHNMTVLLRKLLHDFPIAIVLINHVTTSLLDGAESSIVPALGEAWSHSISTRLLLSWEHEIRAVQVVKSVSEAPLKADFQVTEQGVRAFSRKRSRSDGDDSPTC